MKVSFVQTGPTNETIEFINNFSENARQAIRQTFFRMGRDLKKKTNKDILDITTKTGRWYRVRSVTGRWYWHQASAPFETHANLTGNLRRSLGWKVIGTDRMDFGYGISRPAPAYAGWVEFGHHARNGTWVFPRPSLQNNINGIGFQKYFDEALGQLESK